MCECTQVELLGASWESKSVDAALRHTREMRDRALGRCEAAAASLLAEHAATPAELTPILTRLADELPKQCEAAARHHRKHVMEAKRAACTSTSAAAAAAAAPSTALEPPPLELLPSHAVSKIQVLLASIRLLLYRSAHLDGVDVDVSLLDRLLPTGRCGG
jgi:hypothetical protein